MKSTHDPQMLLTEVFALISQSRAALKDGTLMEMTGMEEQVEKLCGEVMTMVGGDRQAFAAQLSMLHSELTELREELLRAREAVRGQLGGIPSHHKASRAYRTTDAIDGDSSKADEE